MPIFFVLAFEEVAVAVGSLTNTLKGYHDLQYFLFVQNILLSHA